MSQPEVWGTVRPLGDLTTSLALVSPVIAWGGTAYPAPGASWTMSDVAEGDLTLDDARGMWWPLDLEEEVHIKDGQLLAVIGSTVADDLARLDSPVALEKCGEVVTWPIANVGPSTVHVQPMTPSRFRQFAEVIAGTAKQEFDTAVYESPKKLTLRARAALRVLTNIPGVSAEDHIHRSIIASWIDWQRRDDFQHLIYVAAAALGQTTDDILVTAKEVYRRIATDESFAHLPARRTAATPEPDATDLRDYSAVAGENVVYMERYQEIAVAARRFHPSSNEDQHSAADSSR